MDRRSAPSEFAKLPSHSEDIGPNAITQGLINPYDMVGNMLADTTCDLAAARLRPTPLVADSAKEQEDTAYNISNRIGFVRARMK